MQPTCVLSASVRSWTKMMHWAMTSTTQYAESVCDSRPSNEKKLRVVSYMNDDSLVYKSARSMLHPIAEPTPWTKRRDQRVETPTRILELGNSGSTDR